MVVSFHPPQHTLMGHSCNPKDVLLGVGAFEAILASKGAAEAAAQKSFVG